MRNHKLLNPTLTLRQDQLRLQDGVCTAHQRPRLVTWPIHVLPQALLIRHKDSSMCAVIHGYHRLCPAPTTYTGRPAWAYRGIIQVHEESMPPPSPPDSLQAPNLQAAQPDSSPVARMASPPTQALQGWQSICRRQSDSDSSDQACVRHAPLSYANITAF